jgi:hypothetical protein
MDRINVAKEPIDSIAENILIGLGPISFKKIVNSETQQKKI